MNKPLALLFAIVGTLLLASISLFITLRQPWMAILCAVVSLFFIGFGFVVKAKLRKKQQKE
jgi:drug/metabolite transporter (DMT)-like permease